MKRLAFWGASLLLGISGFAASVTSAPPPAPPSVSASAASAIALKNGWNMISSPNNGQKISSSLFTSSGITNIYIYDVASNNYTTPSYIDVGVGYWVYTTADKTLFLSSAYTQSSSTVTIDSILSNAVVGKWNLLGTPIDTSKTELKSKGATAVWWYDPATKDYSNNDAIKAGSGFWYKGVAAPPPPKDNNNSASKPAANDNNSSAAFNMAQTISDGAQITTLAFSGLAMMTGNLDSQSFFPPGKVADYTGFQYLRDNDPDNMGHNTSFLTRVANNVIYILNDTQFAQLKALAVAQQDQINLYGYKRFPLMQAFRRQLESSVPIGSTGLNLNAVKKASHELYAIDGNISFDRALLYAGVINSFDANQTAYLSAMKGKGWKSWPDITDTMVQAKMKSLPQGTAVAVMTYASDLYSWYNGLLEADVYFCPERHGTYFGSFYMKDAPAVGHEGYSINEQLTATAGRALSDSSQGYVTTTQASQISGLGDTQRNNLYANSASNIVGIRTQIATLLRSLLTSTTSADSIKAQVLALSQTYGTLDGENNYNYATVFANVYKTMTSDQKTKLAALRKSILSGKYDDGTAFDFTTATTAYLYSGTVTDAQLSPYISNTDYLFFEP